MKYLKTYESLRDQMTPKSEEDLIKGLDNVSDLEKVEYIIKYKLPYDLLPENPKSGGIECKDIGLTSLPDNLTIYGGLDCSNNKLTKLPKGLVVEGVLLCTNNLLTELPGDLVVGAGMYGKGNPFPYDLHIPDGVNFLSL